MDFEWRPSVETVLRCISTFIGPTWSACWIFLQILTKCLYRCLEGYDMVGTTDLLEAHLTEGCWNLTKRPNVVCKGGIWSFLSWELQQLIQISFLDQRSQDVILLNFPCGKESIWRNCEAATVLSSLAPTSPRDWFSRSLLTIRQVVSNLLI